MIYESLSLKTYLHEQIQGEVALKLLQDLVSFGKQEPALSYFNNKWQQDKNKSWYIHNQVIKIQLS